MNNDDLPPALRSRGSNNQLQNNASGAPVAPSAPKAAAPQGSDAAIRQQALQELEAKAAALDARKVRPPVTGEAESPHMPSRVAQPLEYRAGPMPQKDAKFEHVLAGSVGGVNYAVNGDDIQYVEITLQPNDSLVCDDSSIMYFEDGIEIKSVMNSGGETKGLMGKVLDAGKAAAKGEKIFITTCINTSSQPKKIAFSSAYSGKISVLDMDKLGNNVICQMPAFLCASKTVRLGRASPSESGASAFSQGAKLNKLEGSGVVFICMGGTVYHRVLGKGENLHTSGSVVAARQGTVGYKIKNIMENGKGRIQETVTGPGEVWLQSVPFNKTRDRIVSHVMGVLAMIEKKKKK